jgi:hypothetical protein
MSHPTRTARWHSVSTYVPGAVCEICLSDTNVKAGNVPVIDAQRNLRFGIFRIWSVCERCNSLGSGLVCDVSVNGMLVYQFIHLVESRKTISFIFAPMVFRGGLF